jgi:hypothetical protein
MTAISNRRLGDKLAMLGLLPKECRLIEFAVGVTGAAVLRYEVYFTGETLATFAAALAECADEQLDDDERNRKANDASRP